MYNMLKNFSLLVSTPEKVDCSLKHLDKQYVEVKRAASLQSANVKSVYEMRKCVDLTFLYLFKLLQSADVDVS